MTAPTSIPTTGAAPAGAMAGETTATPSPARWVARGIGRPVNLPPAARGRPIAGGDEADLDAFTAVVNDSLDADGIVIRSSAENEGAEIRHLNGFVLDRDLVLAQRGKTVVAFGRTNIDTEDDGTRRHWTNVMLAPGGRGVGRRTSSRLGGIAPPRPRDGREGGVPRRSGSGPPKLETWWIRFVEPRLSARPVVHRHGRESSMTATAAAGGLEIRRSAASVDAPGRRGDGRGVPDHWGHHAQTEEDIRGRIELPHTDPSLWIVAWAGDEVAARSSRRSCSTTMPPSAGGAASRAVDATAVAWAGGRLGAHRPCPRDDA
jgi:hypothetical protein